MSRYDLFADAAYRDEPYEPFPAASGAELLCLIAYGALLVFLLGDHRYGWFSAAIAIPLAGWLIVRILGEFIAIAVDCALATPLDVSDFDTHADQALAVVTTLPLPAAARDELATRRSQRGTR